MDRMTASDDCIARNGPRVAESLCGEIAGDNELTNALG
jgi:hypothetical protein